MKRKDFLKSGIVAAAAGTTLLNSCTDDKTQKIDVPNLNLNKKYRWKMVTTWPPNFPVFGEAANYLSQWVEKMSGGRMIIKVFGGGELVPALEAFDTVASGTVEMGSGCSYYWSGKSPSAQFFAAVPFGMNSQMMNSWLISGGGYELWEEVYAKFNLVPFYAGNTGVQMGGWFNKEINTVADLQGLKMRIPGIGGKVIEKAGGAAVLVAGGEIYTSLERGVIDAAEWVGPYHDYKMGFHKIAKYYYTPGWHEPGTQMEFFINKYIFEDLPSDLQEIIRTASYRVQAWVLSELDAQNSLFLEKIKEEKDIEIRTFPADVMSKLKDMTDQSVQEMVSSNPLAQKVYNHYQSYFKRAKAYAGISEKAYHNSINI